MSGPTFAALVILVEVQRCCLRETVGGTISASLLSLCLTQFREFIYLGIMKILPNPKCVDLLKQKTNC